jgi:type IV pilus assembly protein PilQ
MGMMTVLEDADIAKVLSTPQIATLNGNTASIVIGETRYFKLEEKTSQLTQQTPVTISTDRFEKYQFDNKLEVTPWVMADRYVTVKIKPEFNIPRTKENTDIPPTADKRALESTVRLKDGQTIVLGGQRSTSETSSTQGIPFLASIPILGKLFSHEKTVKNETQMMIFLTPHVYYKDEAGINPQDYFKSKIEDLQTEKVIKNQKEKCKK